MKNWKNYINSVEKGNNYDSRMGSHGYTQWTTGRDYRVALTSGEILWLQARCYDHMVVKSIEAPEEFLGAEACVPEASVLEFLFSYLFPEGTEEDKIFFLNEEEEATRLIDERRWAEDHMIFSLEITMEIMHAIGRWDRVVSSRSVSRMRGTGCQNIFYRLQCGKKEFEAEIHAGCVDYFSHEIFDKLRSITEIDLAAEKAEKRAFYFKVKELADAAQVPWGIAKLVANADKDMAIDALFKAREIAESELDYATEHELECGIVRRKAMMSELLGEHFDVFDVQGQKRSQQLADYLLGQQCQW